jgi:hypothetical protein
VYFSLSLVNFKQNQLVITITLINSVNEVAYQIFTNKPFIISIDYFSPYRLCIYFSTQTNPHQVYCQRKGGRAIILGINGYLLLFEKVNRSGLLAQLVRASC